MMKRAKESAPKRRPATLSRVNSELQRGARQEKGSTLLQCPVRIPETAENVQDASYTLDGAKTHALLRGIIDSTIDAIWAVDPVNFGLLTWNRSWEQFFLAERGIVLKAGMGRQELWPPGSESIRTWNDFYERALAEGSYTTEYAVSTGTRVLQLSFNLVRQDGHIFAISVFGKDITEKKKMERALRQSEEKFRTIFVSSPAALGISNINDENRIVDVNPAWERATGYQRHEAIGFSAVELGILTDPRLLEECARRVREEGRFRDVEFTYRKKNGDSGIALASGEIVELDDKRYMLSVSLDITDRKRTEESLKSNAQKLERANIALNVLLERRDAETKALESRIVTNVKELIFPYVEKLRSTPLSDVQAAFLDVVHSNLESITSPFAQKMATAYSTLTPTEIKVADLVKNGKSSKEIARLLNVSMGTIDTHRNSIRKKLGIGNRRLNLQAYLLSL
ncbi:MAG: PAS domain S-box protein [Syntrophorhabdales bacterium]